MPPQLVALTEGPDILLDKPILLVGRHQECDILIPSRKISRRHCLIAQVNDYLVIRDLFSTNGIRVNGIRVKEGSLRSGDELTIGNFRYEVRFNGMPSPSVPPKPTQLKVDLPRLAPEEEGNLESCEMPVALSDPPGPRMAPMILGPSPMLPIHQSSFPPPLISPSPAVGQGPVPLLGAVIPDNLDLAPLSAELAPRPKKPTDQIDRQPQ